MTQIQTKPREWARAAAIRSIKTMAQTFIAMTASASVLSEIDWRLTGSAVILAGLLSLATSLAGLPEVDQ